MNFTCRHFQAAKAGSLYVPANDQVSNCNDGVPELVTVITQILQGALEIDISLPIQVVGFGSVIVITAARLLTIILLSVLDAVYDQVITVGDFAILHTKWKLDVGNVLLTQTNHVNALIIIALAFHALNILKSLPLLSKLLIELYAHISQKAIGSADVHNLNLGHTTSIGSIMNWFVVHEFNALITHETSTSCIGLDCLTHTLPVLYIAHDLLLQESVVVFAKKNGHHPHKTSFHSFSYLLLRVNILPVSVFIHNFHFLLCTRENPAGASGLFGHRIGSLFSDTISYGLNLSW